MVPPNEERGHGKFVCEFLEVQLSVSISKIIFVLEKTGENQVDDRIRVVRGKSLSVLHKGERFDVLGPVDSVKEKRGPLFLLLRICGCDVCCCDVCCCCELWYGLRDVHSVDCGGESDSGEESFHFVFF